MSCSLREGKYHSVLSVLGARRFFLMGEGSVAGYVGIGVLESGL